ncbi:MAG: hypothetical protein JOZ66_03030 [Hyphomicrobiales bacterium]|nr:hypothetical protein [Hyphomicrobiales bacterium]
MGFYKDGWETVGSEFPAYKAFVQTCMGAAGYRANLLARRCSPFYAEHNPWCYAPTGMIDGAAWRIYTMINGGSIGGLFYQSPYQ